MLKVKFCGITTLEDALAALDAGADLLGFNFYPKSPRYLQPEACAAITSELRRRGVDSGLVGVFVNASVVEIEAILATCDLDLAQLSGDEPPETLAQLGERGLKTLRPPDAEALEADLQRYPQRIGPPAWLVDAYRPGAYGGTGESADWSLAHSLATRAPILLAGGLRPDNVAEAVRQVRPWGVDTASGVESSPGRKDAEKMKAFVKAIRAEIRA
jgi:phosphoribosylanthranilate isomerase